MPGDMLFAAKIVDMVKHFQEHQGHSITGLSLYLSVWTYFSGTFRGRGGREWGNFGIE